MVAYVDEYKGRFGSGRYAGFSPNRWIAGSSRLAATACSDPGSSAAWPPGTRRWPATSSGSMPTMARGASASCTPPGSGNSACFPRPARSATRTATPWPRAPTAHTGPSSSGGASPSGIRGTWNRRRSGGSRGGDSKRLHRSLGHRTPEQTETEYYANQAVQSASL